MHHITSVLRMKPGQLLILCDGKGTEFTAKIAQSSKMKIAAEIVDKASRELFSPRVMLGQGVPKLDKMDFIIRKADGTGCVHYCTIDYRADHC